MWFDKQMMGHSQVVLVIMSIIIIMVIMWIVSIMLNDSHQKLREAFIFDHDNTLTFCCRLDPSTRPGKDSFQFWLITEILAHDKV